MQIQEALRNEVITGDKLGPDSSSRNHAGGARLGFRSNPRSKLVRNEPREYDFLHLTHKRINHMEIKRES